MKKNYTSLLTGKYNLFPAILLLAAVHGYAQTSIGADTMRGVYTIDQTAPAGTPRTFASFNDAYNFIKNGIDSAVVFNVAPNTGPYNEQLIMAPVPGASALNTISFYGNGNTIQFSPTNSTERAVIKLRDADFVTFDSLVIDASRSSRYGYGVQLLNNADSNTFSRCIIKANDGSSSLDYNGIIINSADDGSISPGNTLCDGNLFNRNTITGGFSGVVLVGGTSSLVSGNKFTNNVITNFRSYGLYIMLTSGTVIEGNDISHPNPTSTNIYYGIYINNPSNSLYISRNRIHHFFPETPTTTVTASAIAFSHAAGAAGMENQVINNLIYKMYGQGAIFAVENIASDNILCYHNTISLDNGGSPYLTAAFFQTGPTAGVVFKNNIVTVARGGTGDKYAEYVDGYSNVTADHNDYYVTGPGSNYHIGYYKGTAYNTLADWQTASAQDAHSVSEDPVYADPQVADNFTPSVASIDNLGEPVGVTTDINNAPRSATTPDIGCYEFTIPPCVAPPVAGTAVANPDTGVCLGTTISLTLTGNSSGGNQTYQWQSAPSATGPWTSISGLRYKKDYQTELTKSNYFRCIVVCGGDTAYSTVAQVTMNQPLISGVYTINPSAPAGTPNNFWSFTQAVAAMDCGIGGSVTFNVAPGTYDEQIRIHKVGGASDTSRITFESNTGAASSVTLTYKGTSAANWVLSLDSAGYVTFKNMTIVATDSSYGRAVTISGTAVHDSVLNCTIQTPAVTTTATGSACVYATGLTGGLNVIKGNTITNGSSGVYIDGSFASQNMPVVIDSNTVSGAYYFGISAGYTPRIQITQNRVTVAAPVNALVYGIEILECDTMFTVDHNTVDISNIDPYTTANGIEIIACDATLQQRGSVNGNKITAVTNISGDVFGLYHFVSSASTMYNNVVAINTTGLISYGLILVDGSGVLCYNNTVHSMATSSQANYAGYFVVDGTKPRTMNVRNNIFSHDGGGKALCISNTTTVYSDYNMLYTSGATLVQGPNKTNYATLQQWRNAFGLDSNSIVYKPAFISDADLHPDVTSPDVWAMHGRGVQISEDSVDMDNNKRPVTLQAGVPDLGAYEFRPTATPPALTATPATPAPGTTQIFTFGTDTVTKISWAPSSNVPTTITVRRYSGIRPPGLHRGQRFMYFYTDVDVTGSGPFNYGIQQYYIDPWQGFIPSQSMIKLGRTNRVGRWSVDTASVVDTVAKTISQTGLVWLDKFTGLAEGDEPYITTFDSSARSMVGAAHGIMRASATVFPVPSRGLVTLQVTGEELLHTKAVLLDMKGRQLKTIFINNYNTPINLGNLPSGMYLLQLANGSNLKILQQE